MNNYHIKRVAIAVLLAVVFGLGFVSTNTLAFSPERPMSTSSVATFRSFGKYDGYVREYLDDYWLGNMVNSGASTISVGDDAGKRLMIGILDFDTSPLPDSATITYAILRVRVANLNLWNGNPYDILGDMYADIISPYFGNLPSLESVDFEWFGDGWAGTFSRATSTGQWIYLEVDPLLYSSINLTNRTQFKVYFIDDNDDNLPQGIAFYSGNHALSTYRPKLTVYYDVP